MSIDNIVDILKGWLDKVLHWDWLSTAVTVVIILAATAILAHIVAVALRKLLKSNRGPLPAASIFVNIGRVAIWVIGVCIVLSSCFGVNVGAAVAALGVGGIAISLGLQQTLSNLIGGLQVIISGIVEPGDRISVGSNEGVVRDVTWRNTTIRDDKGNDVIIPNSVINSTALIKINQPKKAADQEAGQEAKKEESHG